MNSKYRRKAVRISHQTIYYVASHNQVTVTSDLSQAVTYTSHLAGANRQQSQNSRYYTRYNIYMPCAKQVYLPDQTTADSCILRLGTYFNYVALQV